MSQTNQAATNQVPQSTTLTREHLRKHLKVGSQPADEETISRILSANRHPQPTTTRGSLATSRPFSLLR